MNSVNSVKWIKIYNENCKKLLAEAKPANQHQ